MKRTLWIFAVSLLLAATNLFAARVTNIELSYSDNATIARIYVDGQIRFIHQTEVPKDGRPDRVIVDVLSAVHALGAKEFVDLPECPVTGIRTSQYAVAPEKIVRVVFDMKRSYLYKINTDNKSIIVTFTDKTVKKFASWSSTASLARESTSPKITAASPPLNKAKSGQVSTVAKTNQAIEKDRLASLTAPKTAEKPAEPSIPDIKGNSETVAKKPASSTTPATVNKNKQSMTKPSIPKVQMPKEVYGPVFDEKTVLALSEPDERATYKTSRETASTSDKSRPVTTTERTGNEAQSPADKAVSKRLAAASKTTTKTSPPATDSRVLAKQPQPKQSSVSASKKTERADASEQQALTDKLKGAAKSKPSVQKKASVKPVGVTVQTSPPKGSKTAAKTRPTSRFRRSPAKIKGTMVAEFPKRLVIKYRPRLSRDPFMALFNEVRTSEGPMEARIPSVEGLKLVGILESDGGANRALFEDKQDYSYILKSGDKVKKGYVLRVEDDRVYFQIFEYGWSRTVALTLEDI